MGYSELAQRLFEKMTFFLVDPPPTTTTAARPPLPPPPWCHHWCRHHTSPTPPSCHCCRKAVAATVTTAVALSRRRHHCSLHAPAADASIIFGMSADIPPFIARYFCHVFTHYTTFIVPTLCPHFRVFLLLLVYLNLISVSDACNKFTVIVLPP